jgi:catechol 2,3-dioxygenase-like lactoylglutathione lyase family enzyme
MSKASISDVRTIAVAVSDQDRAVAFYRDVLGFEVRMDGAFGEGRWIEVAPAGAATTIALALAGQGIPATAQDTGIRLSTPDAAATHAALLSAGADADAEVLQLGGYVPPMFSVRDPDGNSLVVVQV